MKPNEMKKIFDYNFWAFDRIWECISQISDEQFVEEIDYSTGSIRNILFHVMVGNRIWMSILGGLEFPPRLTLEDFDTSPKTKAKWHELRAEFLDHLSAIDEEQLAGAIDWEILLHLVNRGTDHRSQILAILHHQFHVKTVEQDMILYLAEQKKTI